MPLGFFKGIAADVQLLDSDYVENEKERYVPFSVNPFVEPVGTMQGGQAHSKGGERPSEWVELAGDLAWTASFSSLTSNTAITDPIQLWNYATFFSLTWHLWATQTAYDIKYYTNDWLHRAIFASQLGIYSLLASVSGSFNVGWELSFDVMNPFIGNQTVLTGQAIRENELNTMTNSFRSVNAVLFISRTLLLAQYLRVIWYRRKSKQVWSWRFYLQPASIFVAGCTFLACWIMIKEGDGSKPAAMIQLSLWGFAIAVQVLAAIMTPEDDKMVLKSKNTIAMRLSTLTVIIMGEGLNGICSTLRHSINSLGVTPATTAEAISTLFVLYFLWILYFDGFRIKTSSNKAFQELWLWLHFPLHLSLIMLLEGVKNIFIYGTISRAMSLLTKVFFQSIDLASNAQDWANNQQLKALLLPLKISWEQEFIDLTATIQNSTGDPMTATAAHMVRLLMRCMHEIILSFRDEPDPEAEFLFADFISRSDTAILNGVANGEDWINAFLIRYHKIMAYSENWVFAASGTFLICMAIINTMQRRPRNRFAWSYCHVRAAIGLFLIGIGEMRFRIHDSVVLYSIIIPIIAIGYGIAAGIDYIILYFSIRSIRKKEVFTPGTNAYAGGGVVANPGTPVRQPSQLSQGGAPSTGKAAVGSSGSASGAPIANVIPLLDTSLDPPAGPTV